MKLTVQEAYRALGVPENSTEETVRAAYKKLALESHPDKNPGVDTTEKFQVVGAAYAKVQSHMNGETEAAFDDYDEYEAEDDRMDFFFQLFERMMSSGQGYVPEKGYKASRSQAPRGKAPAPKSGASRLKKRVPKMKTVYCMNCGCYHDEEVEDYEDEEEDIFDSMTVEELAELERLQEEERRIREEQIKLRIKRAEENRRRKEARKKELDKKRQEQHEREMEARQRREQEEADRKLREEALAKAEREELRLRREKEQELRSAVFANAMKNQTALVLKAINENGVKVTDFEGIGDVKKKIFAEETLLHIAARNGNEELARGLLLKGADPRQLNSVGRAPIHMAAGIKPIAGLPVVKLLVEQYNVDVNVRAIDNTETPMHVAAKIGGVETLRYLMEHGGSLQLRDSFGNTPLEQFKISFKGILPKAGTPANELLASMIAEEERVTRLKLEKATKKEQPASIAESNAPTTELDTEFQKKQQKKLETLKQKQQEEEKRLLALATKANEAQGKKKATKKPAVTHQDQPKQPKSQPQPQPQSQKDVSAALPSHKSVATSAKPSPVPSQAQSATPPRAQSPPAPPSTAHELDPAFVRSLHDMGFPESHVVRALGQSRNPNVIFDLLTQFRLEEETEKEEARFSAEEVVSEEPDLPLGEDGDDQDHEQSFHTPPESPAPLAQTPPPQALSPQPAAHARPQPAHPSPPPMSPPEQHYQSARFTAAPVRYAPPALHWQTPLPPVARPQAEVYQQPLARPSRPVRPVLADPRSVATSTAETTAANAVGTIPVVRPYRPPQLFTSQAQAQAQRSTGSATQPQRPPTARPQVPQPQSLSQAQLLRQQQQQEERQQQQQQLQLQRQQERQLLQQRQQQDQQQQQQLLAEMYQQQFAELSRQQQQSSSLLSFLPQQPQQQYGQPQIQYVPVPLDYFGSTAWDPGDQEVPAAAATGYPYFQYWGQQGSLFSNPGYGPTEPAE